ncbi:MAG: GTPase KRas precursor [Candidatus Heimdallarchaeota archaeon LC_3]|nr:MAG: GTPase KRas precursor [Candidatus Heimdallarchaeota archaeon LC_3]
MNYDDHILKILVIGELGVGKTTAISRFVDGKFISNMKSTIGVDFSLKHLKYHENGKDIANVALQIWDVAGEKRFRDILPVYIQGTKGIIATFDSTSFNTLEALVDWFDKIDSLIKIDGIPIILMSTKHDLNPNMDTEIVKRFKEKNGLFNYFQTSSVSGENIEDVFYSLAKKIVYS